MNVDDLRSVLRTERQKDSLQQLRESFYEDVAEFIAEQKEMRNRRAEELGTHYSSEIRRITDEIETAEEVVTSIYERRVGKVVKAASFAAAGMSSSTEGLTHEEKRLFDDLVTRIEQNRTTVLSTLEDVEANTSPPTDTPAGNVTTDEPTTQSATADAATTASSDPTIPPDEPDPESEAPETEDAGDVLAGAMGGSSNESLPTDDEQSVTPTEQSAATDEQSAATDETSGIDRPTDEAAAVIGDDTPPTPEPSAEEHAESESPDDDDPLSGLTDDRETVRITADVGTIFGVDEREYDLAREDVVTLPSANADPLVERGAAERLE